MYINYAELYDVRPGEINFNGAYNRMKKVIDKKGILHFGNYFKKYLIENGTKKSKY